MNDQKIKNNKQDVDASEKFLEALILGFLGFLILPLFISKKYVESRATHTITWNLFSLRSLALKLAPFSILALIASDYLAIRFALKTEYFPFFILIIFGWVFGLPIWILAGIRKLRVIASALDNGVYDLSKSASVRRTLFRIGFDNARKILLNYGNVFPKRTANGKPIVAISAQSPDFRLIQDIKTKPDTYIFNEMRDGEWITFPVEGSEYPHHLVIGATGSGKTTLLSRMTLTALQENYRVVFIDFKGGEQERNLILGISNYLDRKIKSVTWPGTGINLFTGTPEEIYDKVIGFLPSPTGGASDYYRARLIKAIKAVVINSNMPSPKNANEIIDRIYNGSSFSSTPEDRNFFAQKEKGTPIGHDLSFSLASYLTSLMRKGDERTDGGFTWSDDWDLAFIQLNSTKEEFIRLGSAILSDFNFWLRSTNRYQNDKPILLIVDEAGVLNRIQGSPALTDLIARARSRNVSVVLSSQTLTGIGEESDEILKTGPIRWLGRTNSPEDMVMAGGTKEVIETSFSYEEGGWDGTKSARQQESFVISPTLIRQLSTFSWNISDGGKAIWAYAPPLK